MAKLPRLVASVLVPLALLGCANSDLGPKQTIGALAGAGTGALIGAHIGHGRGRLVATSVGTLLGAYLGNEAGKSLDRADALYARGAEYRALEYAPSGHETAWRNPDTGHYGSVTPDRDVRERGRYVLPRVPAPGADRRRQPRRLRHRVPHAGWPVAGGALTLEVRASSRPSGRAAAPVCPLGRRPPRLSPWRRPSSMWRRLPRALWPRAVGPRSAAAGGGAAALTYAARGLIFQRLAIAPAR
jgi:surface antigen